VDSSPYTKEAPLTASFALNQKITGRNSDKDVRHIEIDLGDSGLRYQPGDALGVWYENDAELVQELLQLVWLKGDEQVEVRGETLPLAEALRLGRYHPLDIHRRGNAHRVWLSWYQHYFVWGMTAGIIRELALQIGLKP